MVNNSIGSLIGTACTFLAAFLVYFLGSHVANDLNSQMILVITTAIIHGTAITVLLSVHLRKRVRTNLMDYFLWYGVIGITTGIAFVASGGQQIGLPLAGFYAILMGFSMVVARVIVKLFQHIPALNMPRFSPA